MKAHMWGATGLILLGALSAPIAAQGQSEPKPKVEVVGSVGAYGGYFPSGFPVVDRPVIQGVSIQP